MVLRSLESVLAGIDSGRVTPGNWSDSGIALGKSRVEC